MVRFGHDLPEFAMVPLLDRPEAIDARSGIISRDLEATATLALSALIGSLDHCASPDWVRKLDKSCAALATAQLRCHAFLEEVSEPIRSRVPSILIAGIVAPRGDV